MCTGSRIQAGKRMGIRIHSPAFPSFLWVEGRKHTADNFAADPRGQKWGNMCRHDPEPGQNLPSHQKNIYFYMRLLHNSWSLGNVIDYLQNFFFIYIYIFFSFGVHFCRTSYWRRARMAKPYFPGVCALCTAVFGKVMLIRPCLQHVGSCWFVFSPGFFALLRR